ncbi:MAG: restriction endonuclease [bacterium]|nr:restriction endonuclease [bacterium]
MQRRNEETPEQRDFVGRFILERMRYMQNLERSHRKNTVFYYKYKHEIESAEKLGYEYARNPGGYASSARHSKGDARTFDWDESTQRLISEDEEARRLTDQFEQGTFDPTNSTPHILLNQVIASVEELTPQLISHLQTRHEDLSVIPPSVFEHLIGEILAARGFKDVKLVGRERWTSADLCAVHILDSVGQAIRFYIEVKRTRRSIGIDVINQVHGSILIERPKFGWHVGMIVSLGGFKKTRKLSREKLSLLGIELRDRQDILRWLGDWRPDRTGLWLPKSAFSGQHQVDAIC